MSDEFEGFRQVARFPAWLTNFKAAHQGQWRIEFGVESFAKDEAWAVTTDEGLELTVVVLSRAPAMRGVARPAVDVVADAIPRIAPATPDVPSRTPVEVLADAARRVGQPVTGISFANE